MLQGFSEEEFEENVELKSNTTVQSLKFHYIGVRGGGTFFFTTDFVVVFLNQTEIDLLKRNKYHRKLFFFEIVNFGNFY